MGVREVAELGVVWRHATDSERLLVLLGLNAGMKPAEMFTLRWDEIKDGHIKRVRHKSGVYSEFQLWDETVQGLRWWERVRGRQGDVVLITERGEPFDRQRIGNIWYRLEQRIRRTGGDTSWWGSVSTLRRTANQMVRGVAGGEIAGIYLCHGQPVTTDELSDLYSQRPFGKVAEALVEVRRELEPVFAGVDAFSSTQIGRRARGARAVTSV